MARPRKPQRTVVIGGMHPEYPGDPWHYALCRMRDACRAFGLRPIDGPFGDFGDPDGYVAAARRASVLGFEGKWCIHPSQIELANSVFSPDDRFTLLPNCCLGCCDRAPAFMIDGDLYTNVTPDQLDDILNKYQ